MENQPDLFLVKPFNRALLHQRLGRLLQIKIKLADCYYSLSYQDYAKTVECCEQVLSKADSSLASYAEQIKIKALLLGGQPQLAAQELELLLSVKPLLWAKLYHGMATHALGEYDLAALEFQAIIKETPLCFECL